VIQSTTLPGFWTGLVVQVPNTARVDLTFPAESADREQFSGSYVLRGEAEGTFSATVSGDQLSLQLSAEDAFGEWHVDLTVTEDMMIGPVSQGQGGKPIAGIVMFKPAEIDIFGAWSGHNTGIVADKQKW
jgi:hypothetical protein